MSWQTARVDAANIVASDYPPGRLAGESITLAAYADGETYRQLNYKLAEKWSLAYYRIVTTAVCRILRKRGAIVTYKTVEITNK